MSLIAKNDGEKFELTPEGTHLARCFRLIDVGTQTFEYQGKEKKAHKVLISWEIPAELREDGTPFQISKKYTVSLHEKASLRKDLEAWRGRAFTEQELDGFDLKNIVGKACYINIAHEVKGDKTYANIKSIMALPKGVNCPPLVNTPIIFDLDNFDAMVYNGLSDGIKKLIEASQEWYDKDAVAKSDATQTHEGDGIPF